MEQLSMFNDDKVDAPAEDPCDETSKILRYNYEQLDTFDEKCSLSNKNEQRRQVCLDWKKRCTREDYILTIERKIQQAEEKLEMKDNLIKQYEEDKRLSIENNLLYKKLCTNMIILQQNYRDVQEENQRIKRDLEHMSSLIMKHGLIKTPRAEAEILLKQTSSEWKDRFKKLEKNLQAEISDKIQLFNKYLQAQFNHNKCLIARDMNQCDIALDVLDKINKFIDKTMAIQNFVDNTSWINQLDILRTIMKDHEKEYLDLSRQVNSKIVPHEKLCSINLNELELPRCSFEKLSETVESAFDKFDRIHCQMLHKLATTSQQLQGSQFSSLKSESDQGYKTATRKDVVGSKSSFVSNASDASVIFTGDQENLTRVKSVNHNTKKQDEEYMTKNCNHDRRVHSIDDHSVSNHRADSPTKHHRNSTASRDVVEPKKRNPLALANEILSSTARSMDFTPKKMGAKKSASIEMIMDLMKKKYPQLSREELEDILIKIRENHNDSLKGISVDLILKESEQFCPVQYNETSHEKVKNERINDLFVLEIRRGKHWNGEYVEQWIASIANGNKNLTWELSKSKKNSRLQWLLKTCSVEFKKRLFDEFRITGKEIFEVKRYRTFEEKEEEDLQVLQIEKFRKEGYAIVLLARDEYLRIYKGTVVKNLRWNRNSKMYLEVE